MNKGNHLIWSNYHIDYKDWKEDIERDYPDLPMMNDTIRC